MRGIQSNGLPKAKGDLRRGVKNRNLALRFGPDNQETRAANKPFSGTLGTFLNGPDSSTSGHDCNLSFTKLSEAGLSCTTGGETGRRELLSSHCRCRKQRCFAVFFGIVAAQDCAAIPSCMVQHRSLVRVNMTFVPEAWVRRAIRRHRIRRMRIARCDFFVRGRERAGRPALRRVGTGC